MCKKNCTIKIIFFTRKDTESNGKNHLPAFNGSVKEEWSLVIASSSQINAMVFRKEVSKFGVRCLGQRILFPQVRSQVSIRLSNGCVGCLGWKKKIVLKELAWIFKKITKIAQSSSGAASRCVAIFNSSHLQKLLRNWSADNSSTTGCRNQSHLHGPALTSDLRNLKNKLTLIEHIQRKKKEKNQRQLVVHVKRIIIFIRDWWGFFIILIKTPPAKSIRLPCTAQYGVYRSCYPNSLAELEQLTTWPKL